MNVLSLFDGCSGGQVALGRAGVFITNYYASEIDKYAIRVTNKNFPDTIQLGDVTQWHTWKIPKIDLLIGGSPCQGFSRSGALRGFKDERSRLFFEYVDCLSIFKPKWFLLENVYMKQGWQDVISLYLGVEPIRINSSLFSAQLRDRLYWTNLPVDLDIQDRNLGWGDIQENSASNVFYYTNKSFEWIFKSKKRSDKFRLYTNLSKEKMQTVEASCFKGYSNQRCFGILDNNSIRYISCLECERLQTFPDNYTAGVSNTQRYKMLGNAFTVDVIAHILKNLVTRGENI